MRCLLSLILLVAAATAGCSNFMVADIAVNQGSKAQLEEFEKVSIGMSPKQVRALLGPPHTRWDLENEVWIYYYQRRDAKTDEQAGMQITFAGDEIIEFKRLQPREDGSE